MNNSYKELPSGYRLIKSYKIKGSDLQVVINLFIIFLLVLPIVTLSLLKKNSFTIPKDEKEILIEALIACLILLVGLVIIMLVHELIHAFLYKKYTNEKPRLIINLQEISLKVENIYIKKKEIKTIFIAPALILPILFLIPILILPFNLLNMSLILLFAITLGGSGDDIFYVILISKLSKDGLYLSKDNMIYLYDVY